MTLKINPTIDHSNSRYNAVLPTSTNLATREMAEQKGTKRESDMQVPGRGSGRQTLLKAAQPPGATHLGESVRQHSYEASLRSTPSSRTTVCLHEELYQQTRLTVVRSGWVCPPQ